MRQFARTFTDAQQLPDKTAAFFLAVEDARILSGNIERIHELYDAGVRFMSLNWSAKTRWAAAMIPIPRSRISDEA